MILLYVVDQSRLDAILLGSDPYSWTMERALGHTDIFCKPDKLIYLLPKVCSKGLPTVDDAIRLGIRNLFLHKKVQLR